MIKPKAQIGDKIKIVSVGMLMSMYDEKDFHQNNTLQSLSWLSNANLIGYVNSVTLLGDEIYEYDVSFPKIVQSVKLYDSDFYVVNLPKGELYKDIKVYLCVDSQGGQCDRLCFGDKALIDNANASIDCWNDGRTEERYEYVNDTDNALSILNTDNFDVSIVEPNSVHVTWDYIVTDTDTITYGTCDPLVHSPKHIWDLIEKGIYSPINLIVDLTVSSDNDTI